MPIPPPLELLSSATLKGMDKRRRLAMERLLSCDGPLPLSFLVTPETTGRNLHSHNYWEIFITFPRREVHASVLRIIPPGCRHAGWMHSAVMDCLAIDLSYGMIHCAAFPTVFRDPGNFLFLKPILLHLSMLHEMAHSLGAEAQPWLDMQAPALMRELAALFLEMYQEGHGRYAKGRTTPSNLDISMLEGLSDPKASIADIALALGVKGKSLSRTFQRKFGVSAKRYQVILRLRYACDLLAEGKISVSEVARTSGWRDPRHFATIFRKYTDMTPTEFARRNPGAVIAYPDNLPHFADD